MFAPVVKNIYNAEKGFIFEGLNNKKWGEDTDNADMTEEKELLYTFDPPASFNKHSYGYYGGGDYFIKIYNNGNRKFLDIGKDYHMTNRIFRFSKPNGAPPTPYQAWESQWPNEEIEHLTFAIGDNFNPEVLNRPYIYWDGEIMESEPAQINIAIHKSRLNEFTNGDIVDMFA